MMPSFELDAPDYFTVGAVGPPGERVFYVQGREAGTVVTLKTEKEQVRALAEYLAGVLAKLAPLATPAPVDLPLLEPVTPAWPIASLGLGYDESEDRIIIVANAVSEDEEHEADAETAAAARFAITRTQAASFVERARSLMKSGRPMCPMCSAPMDPGGHVCPRANGHIVAHD